MPYTRLQKRRIHREAKSKLGLLKTKAEDRDEFMDDCMADMMDDGMDEDEAKQECALLWEDENG